MGCHPAGSERVPAPEPGETVVFYDHFPQGFALPASCFLRQFLDHFHLQPHHIGANAMMTLAAFAALCEAYLGIWPNVELFRRLIYFKTQTAETIPVVCGTASFYARKTADFPDIKANRIADVKLQASWKWGLKPYDRDNLIAEVRLSGLASVSPPLRF
jgi:hypothetical protein